MRPFALLRLCGRLCLQCLLDRLHHDVADDDLPLSAVTVDELVDDFFLAVADVKFHSVVAHEGTVFVGHDKRISVLDE